MGKLKPYRCHNPKCADDPHGKQRHDFAAEFPVCPKCKWDGRKPGFSNGVIALACIHFDPPNQVQAYNPNVTHASLKCRACDPAKPIAGGHGTGNPTAVTCPACKETPAFKAAIEAWQEGRYEDYVVTLQDGLLGKGE